MLNDIQQKIDYYAQLERENTRLRVELAEVQAECKELKRKIRVLAEASMTLRLAR